MDKPKIIDPIALPSDGVVTSDGVLPEPFLSEPGAWKQRKPNSRANRRLAARELFGEPSKQVTPLRRKEPTPPPRPITASQQHPEGPALSPADVAAITSSLQTTYADQSTPAGVCVADGWGLSITVERGHLQVADGIGPHRRSRRFARATHGLSRLVVLGRTGYLSLEALAWCAELDIAVLVLDPDQPQPSLTSVPTGSEDARLIRVQAQAAGSPLGLDIVRALLGAKLSGQASICQHQFGAKTAAAMIEDLAASLAVAESTNEARQLEAWAAATYWQAWAASEATAIRFTRQDLVRVPQHWVHFDGRRSVLKSVNGNRRAERPLNAVLNYLYALAELEAGLACQLLGLNPSLGLLHADARGRASMALDLMEPLRPRVEAYSLDLLQRRNFRRHDFSEASDGHVRLLAPLTHELAATLPRWRQEVASWAELVASRLGQSITGKYQPTAPLTGRLRKQAQAQVRSRQTASPSHHQTNSEANRQTSSEAMRQSSSAAMAHSSLLPQLMRELAAQPGHPRQRPPLTAEQPPAITCAECGAEILGRFRRYCPGCGVLLPGFDAVTNARRGRAIAASRAQDTAWRAEHPQPRRRASEVERLDFQQRILPGLAEVKLQQIMAALGCAKSTASGFRSGALVPGRRHWARLAELAGAAPSIG